MKITIDRKTFADALMDVAPFAPAKTPVPVLKYAKITTKGKRMKIEANDTNAGIARYIDVIDSDSDGSFLVDISAFSKFVQKINGDTMDVCADGTTVEVTHCKGKAEFASDNPDLFPSFRTDENDARDIVIPASTLKEIINKGKSFVATDTLRPQLCAIYVYKKDTELGFFASDTRKLIYGRYANNDNSETSWLIAPTCFSALSKLCAAGGDVNIKVSDTHAVYRLGNTIIQTCLPNGKFPDCKRLIPQDFAIECALDKSELNDSLARLSLFSGDTQLIKFQISRMDMVMSCDNISKMEKSSETLAHSGCTGEITIGANISNMAAAINSFGVSDIVMKMNDESKPIVITSASEDNILVLVMPMRFASYD